MTFKDDYVPVWYQLLPNPFAVDYTNDFNTNTGVCDVYTDVEMKKYFDKILTEILEYIDTEVHNELCAAGCLENDSDIEKSQLKIKILNELMADIGNRFYDYSEDNENE